MKKRGFTLIELMVAASILSIGIVAVLRSFSSCATALGSIRNRIMAISFLDQKAGEIEQKAREEGGIAEKDEEAEITLGSRQATWKLEVVVEPEEETEEQEIEEQEIEEQENIGEVKLSLFWKEAGREKDETVAIYLPTKK